jgi:hypothetical protein
MTSLPIIAPEEDALYSTNYIDNLSTLASGDVIVLKEKDREYGGSWLKRGGVGVFMMLARKWDRLETAMESQAERPVTDATDIPIDRYDIIQRGVRDQRTEGILDDIADLRRYLLLAEAEIRAQQAIPF